MVSACLERESAVLASLVTFLISAEVEAPTAGTALLNASTSAIVMAM